ncbi:hypothetical protein OIU83_00360 [Flavobacterium sp. LS1R49]|uniref:Uncharacterized protein n=1 Tax=Flavobacterium shii TaxID=2987687 RepID=A0A9X2ZCG0_9FLAO|nr:hypothetical protein [Flavobacterium shii]MCV9926091.1 hypothetical protein [Flavobacterium shii]
MKKIYIVEFPSNLGLKEPQPNKEPGVKHLPEWLKKHDLYNSLNPESIL